ncbi:MAG: hypothetical protein IJR97_09925 [Clostridia bacterium]|nr:hypothetical protein [Clostridia bacterium]
MDGDEKELSPAASDKQQVRGVKWFFRELGHFYADFFRAAAGLVILLFAILFKPFISSDGERNREEDHDPEQR